MPPLAPEQEHVVVDVKYYNAEHQRRLLAYPTHDNIEQVVRHGIRIPTAEFLTYYLFHLKRTGAPVFGSYNQLATQTQRAITDLEHLVAFNGRSISTANGVADLPRTIREHLGESVGLSVINRIHNLTRADWGALPEYPSGYGLRTFDYEIASDGERIIQVENKGSFVVLNTDQSDAIKKHKCDIEEKKTAIRGQEEENTYPHPAALRYGTITAVDARPDSNIRCWLLDPPSEQSQLNPRTVRLLNRMRFLRDCISFYSVRSQLASALSTRVAALEAIDDPLQLDGVQLRTGRDKLFNIRHYTPDEIEEGDSIWPANKSTVTDESAGGVVFPLGREAVFFLGIRDELLINAANQSFSSILDYRAKVGSVIKEVECVVNPKRWAKFGSSAPLLKTPASRDGYVRFKLSGQLHTSPEGIVFGVLPCNVPRQ